MHFFNNEFVIEGTNGSSVGVDWQAIGNSKGEGQGEIWWYGNLVRLRGSGTTLSRFNSPFCGDDTGSYRFYHFNNTWDLEQSGGSTREVAALCSSPPGELVRETNNAFRKASVVHATDATTKTYASEICSESFQPNCTQNTTGRNGWFSGGVAGTFNTGRWQALSNWAPQASGPLSGTGTCDPDGDGVAGVDYNFDGINDTSWRDIAGNLISCPTPTSPISIGAIQLAQAAGPPDTTPPSAPTGLTVTSLALAVPGEAPTIAATVPPIEKTSIFRAMLANLLETLHNLLNQLLR
jgi:hypothetical protein